MNKNGAHDMVLASLRPTPEPNENLMSKIQVRMIEATSFQPCQDS